MSKTLTIIYYSLTGGSEALAHAAAEAASKAEAEIDVRSIDARQAGPDDLLGADGYIFAFPENLAAIAGEMKAFFDRCYYPCLEKLQGRPYALLVCAGSDGENAVKQAERIATGWRLKKVTASQIICTHAQTPEQILAPKVIGEDGLAKARETGATLAAGLAMGVF
ncbi:MAG: NAD(P)H-dependent oxidoreductase [Sphingorhabdus sp.]